MMDRSIEAMAEYYNNRTREVTPTPTLRDTPLNLPCGPKPFVASAGRKDDKDKPQLQDLFRFIPAAALGAVAEVMSHGAEKYGERNWEDDGLSIQRIQGAVLRHTHQRLRGDLIDDDSGLLHSAHAAASALMALAKDLGACEPVEDELIGVWLGRLEEKLRLSLEKQARAMRGDDSEVQRAETAPSE